MRGIFKTKKEGSETPPFFTGEPVNPNHYIGFYMEKNVEGEEITFSLKKKSIPKELKENFLYLDVSLKIFLESMFNKFFFH